LHKRKLVLTLVALLALGALIAGCGGGGSSSGGSTATAGESESGGSGDAGGEGSTKVVFIKEADKICRAADAKLAEEVADYAKKHNIPITEEGPSKDQEIELFHAVVLPNIARQAEEIAALTPPEGDEAKVEDITDTLSAEVAEAEEADGVPGEGTLEGARKKAKAYGLRNCGS